MRNTVKINWKTKTMSRIIVAIIIISLIIFFHFYPQNFINKWFETPFSEIRIVDLWVLIIIY
jgi:uncharacterized protein YqfA (UPF0365 family)